MIAAAIALWLAAAGPGDGGLPDGGAAPGPGRSAPARADRRDGGAGAEARRADDADLVRHLSEIENLELLQNMELFDPGPEEEPPARK